MLALLIRFHRSLLALGGYLGLLYVPADIWGLPETYPALRTVLEMDRETAVMIFAGLLVLYVAWIDARPLITKWRLRQKKELDVHPQIFWRTKTIKDESLKAPMYKNVAHIHVTNVSKTKKTLRAVSATDILISDYNRLKEQLSGAQRVDLQHGQSALFVLGYFLSDTLCGLPDDTIQYSSEDVLRLAHYDASNPYKTFCPTDKYSLGFGPNAKWDHGTVLISADDVTGTIVKYELDASTEPHLKIVSSNQMTTS